MSDREESTIERTESCLEIEFNPLTLGSDVVMFLRPEAGDIAVTLGILNLFGEATGLKTNLQKSNVLPIRCGATELAAMQNLLPCALTDFPCKYLGLPLCLKKLTKEQIQPIIGRIVDQLPG